VNRLRRYSARRRAHGSAADSTDVWRSTSSRRSARAEERSVTTNARSEALRELEADELEVAIDRTRDHII